MSKLNDSDKTRMNAAYNEGVKNITEEDVAKTLGREAEFKAKLGKLGETWRDAQTLFCMLKDYKAKKYTAVPWKMIAAIVFAITYFLWPFDIIPDVLPLVGWSDDIGIFGIVLYSFKAEITAYRRWLARQKSERDKEFEIVD